MTPGARRVWPLLLALLLVLCAPARAEDPRARLSAFFDDLRTLSGAFSQTVVDAAGATVQEAAGRFWISRPDRFRWDYDTPYDQLLVADGERLWTFDPDLEQVTVKPLEQVLPGTPAMLLSSARDPGELFDIETGQAADSLQWLVLTPRDADAGFRRLRLGFDADGLARMDIEDTFDQVTRLRFSDLQRNTEVDAGLFRFRPPEGADVIGGP